MIVTRRRRKPFPWRRLILPVVAIGLVVFAFAWPPSRGVITGGPLSPLLQNVGSRFDTIAAPFHFAAQNQVLTDQNRQIVQLRSQIADLQAQSAAKDKQISSLNGQIGQLQSQAASSRSAATSPSAAPAAGAAAQSNPARRKRDFDRVQEIAWEQAPFLYLLNKNTLIAVSPSLHNVKAASIRPYAYWNIESLSLSTQVAGRQP